MLSQPDVCSKPRNPSHTCQGSDLAEPGLIDRQGRCVCPALCPQECLCSQLPCKGHTCTALRTHQTAVPPWGGERVYSGPRAEERGPREVALEGP